jgi:hypothetical protein
MQSLAATGGLQRTERRRSPRGANIGTGADVSPRRRPAPCPISQLSANATSYVEVRRVSRVSALGFWRVAILPLLSLLREAAVYHGRADDPPLEGAGFEPSVPQKTTGHSEARYIGLHAFGTSSRACAYRANRCLANNTATNSSPKTSLGTNRTVRKPAAAKESARGFSRQGVSRSRATGRLARRKAGRRRRVDPCRDLLRRRRATARHPMCRARIRRFRRDRARAVPAHRANID